MHIKDNIIAGNGAGAVNDQFWRVARAKTPAKFDYHMKRLHQLFPGAAAALVKIDPTIYATAHVPRNRFGHDTNAVNECVNGLIKEHRSYNVLDLLTALWDRAMDTRFRRFCAAQIEMKKGARFTPCCHKLLKESKRHAGGLRVRPSTMTEAKILHPAGYIYDVRVDHIIGTTFCTCLRPQTRGMPCGHVLAFFQHQRWNLDRYLPFFYDLTTWLLQHSKPLPVINTSSLRPEPDFLCDPPCTRAPRGRPRKERLRRGEVRNRQGLMPAGLQMTQQQGWQMAERSRGRCSTCGDALHNRRTFRRPHN